MGQTKEIVAHKASSWGLEQEHIVSTDGCVRNAKIHNFGGDCALFLAQKIRLVKLPVTNYTLCHLVSTQAMR